nr:hypothetical protein GCM10020063_092130 [Dactylosporangium thailandense]
MVPWVEAAAAAHGAFEVEVLDLRDWPLPFFAEHFGTVGDINDPTYSQPLVKAWNRAVQDADAYLVVTGEYNLLEHWTSMEATDVHGESDYGRVPGRQGRELRGSIGRIHPRTPATDPCNLILDPGSADTRPAKARQGLEVPADDLRQAAYSYSWGMPPR